MGLYFLLGFGCLLLQVSGEQTATNQAGSLQESYNSDAPVDPFPPIEVLVSTVESLLQVFKDCGIGYVSLIFAADEETYQNFAKCLKVNAINLKYIMRGLTHSIPPVVTGYFLPLLEDIYDKIELYHESFMKFVGRILIPVNKLVPNLIQVLMENSISFDQDHLIRNVGNLIKDFITEVRNKLHSSSLHIDFDLY